MNHDPRNNPRGTGDGRRPDHRVNETARQSPKTSRQNPQPANVRHRGNRKPNPRKDDNELLELIRDLFSPESMKYRWELLKVSLRSSISNLTTTIFLSKERIFCGAVTGVILVVLALLQTTLFSTIQPFGAIPDLMISFVLALSVTEGRRWGAIWGIIAGVVIESLSVPEFYLMPLLYMLTGYFGGVICRHYLSETAAVRAVLTLGVIPVKGVFTAIYTVFSPIYFTAGEAFLQVILPEAGATLILAAPVHILVYLCLKPFHHTRAEMVSEK